LANIEEKVEKLIINNVINLGYELYDVEYVKEGKDHFLRIYIDSGGVINLEDCEKVSNEITELLDAKDYISEQYFLEVSSPGIERILRTEKHLKDNIGNMISIKLFTPIEKQKQYIGKLAEFDNNILAIEIEKEKLEIERKNISQIKLWHNWEEG